jgi:hypothetical protein
VSKRSRSDSGYIQHDVFENEAGAVFAGDDPVEPALNPQVEPSRVWQEARGHIGVAPIAVTSTLKTILQRA